MLRRTQAATASNVAPGATEEVATVSKVSQLNAQIAALEKQKREVALAEIGGNFDTVKDRIASGFSVLVQDAEALKLAYNTGEQKYYAPWEIQAKRDDWRIRDFISAKGNPQTVEQIADGVDYDTTVEKVQAVLDKDAKHKRQLFGFVGNKVWITDKPQPQN